MPMLRRIAAIALLGMSPLAPAQVVFETPPNLNVQIADDAYTGALSSMTCVTIPVTGGSTVKGVMVRASIDHTWVGDIVLKLVSPASTIVTLVSRPGFDDLADDGTGGDGNGSDLVSIAPIVFIDAGPTSAENMGNGLSNTGTVCRDDGICTYDPNNGAASAGKLAAFIGQTMAGSWKFCAGDSAPGDVGAIQQIRLTFVGEGKLQISPTTVDFGSVRQGDASPERFVTLTNIGTAALTVTSLSTALPPFQRTTTGTCGNSLPRVIAVNAPCTLGYTFLPQSQNSASQSFALQTDGSGDTGFLLKGSGDTVFADGFEP